MYLLVIVVQRVITPFAGFFSWNDRTSMRTFLTHTKIDQLARYVYSSKFLSLVGTSERKNDNRK